MLSGGLFNVRLTGDGMVAFTTQYDSVTLLVTPENPVITDPNATVAWSGNLEPSIRADFSFKTFLGRGSGGSIQTEFKGNGFVVNPALSRSRISSELIRKYESWCGL